MFCHGIYKSARPIRICCANADLFYAEILIGGGDPSRYGTLPSPPWGRSCPQSLGFGSARKAMGHRSRYGALGLPQRVPVNELNYKGKSKIRETPKTNKLLAIHLQI